MADVNSTGIDELEEKKWLISRIDLYHETIIEELQNTKSKYEEASEQGTSKLRSYRSYVLSGLGVFLTILLGYNSVYPMHQWIFFTFLTGLGISGLVTIIIFNWLIGLIENIFAQLVEIFNDDIGNLNFSHGYMITSMANLSKITLEFVRNYFIFSILLTFAISIRTSKSMKKIAEEYSKLNDVKKSLLKEAETFEEQKEHIPEYYGRLDRSQNMPLGLLKIIDESLVEYKPKN